MELPGPRIKREIKTVGAMIRIYCKGHHKPEGKLCEDCAELKEYALQRLMRCPFQEDKTPCSKCPRHCYKPEKREEIKKVMRYAGPRMMLRHPILAIRHLLDGKRKREPEV